VIISKLENTKRKSIRKQENDIIVAEEITIMRGLAMYTIAVSMKRRYLAIIEVVFAPPPHMLRYHIVVVNDIVA